MDDDPRPRVSRRRLLASVGAVGVGGLAAVPAAGAQTQVTVYAVIPEAEDFTDDYSGLMVHLGGESTGELRARDVNGCNIPDWPPDELSAYDGSLIDKKGDDPVTSVPTQVYVPASRDISTGTLFIVNRTHDCPAGYVGLELEQIGASTVDTGTASPTAEATGTDDGSAAGPGFGVPAALAGVGGLAALVRLLRGGREE